MPATRPLTVYGDPARARDRLKRLMKRGQELLAQVDAAEERLTHVTETSTASRGSLAFAAAFMQEEYDQSSSLVAWSRSIRNQLNSALGSAAATCLPARSVPRPQRNGEAAALLSRQREFVTDRIDDLRRVLAQLPASSASASPQVAAFAEVRVSGLIEEVQLNTYLQRMSTRRKPQQISLAIGAAKELMEAVLVGALEILDPSATPETEFAKLAKQVRRLLDARTTAAGLSLPGWDAAQTVAGFVSVEAGLSELRNRVGSGHGRTRLPSGLREAHALLAIDVAHAHARYVVRTLADLRLLTLETADWI